MHIRVAFVGNPNCGKTTLFNSYTGAKHKVGNWAGVTVDKKEGTIRHDGNTLTLVDLPGIYSISPYSMEELLSREYILNADPDVIVNIVDASNMERNLFLTLQLIEMGKPVVIALNMIDLVEERGAHVHTERLSAELGVPVVTVSALKKTGLTKLLHQIIKTARKKEEYQCISIDYGLEINEKIDRVAKVILKNHVDIEEKVVRWLSIKVLEQDSEIIKKLQLPQTNNDNLSEQIGQVKYDYISSFIHEVIQSNHDEITVSDRIDAVITNSFVGLPIFALVMALVFAFTFSVGNYFAGLLDGGLILLSESVTNLLTEMDVAKWLIALSVEGIIGGVGGMLIFLPNIACLFIAISILEDSGYMARVALLMDKYMHKIGLNGKAFIPMILGFGCSVPAIMTARTLENEKDRLVTTLVTPFMSCSARMPIYVLFSGIFFPGREIIIAFSLYILGVFIALTVALIFKKTLKKGEKGLLILELPTYKRPSFKSVILYSWQKVKDYIVRAGTIIFIASVVLWFLLSFSFKGYVDMTDSFGAAIGRFIAPVFGPVGFGHWEAALSLLAGVMGKEIVVSSMSVIYGVGDGGFQEALMASGFSALSAYAFMVFCLLYTPCIATIAIIKKELNSWKWMFFSLFYQLGIAWLVSMLVYQIGKLLGL